MAWDFGIDLHYKHYIMIGLIILMNNGIKFKSKFESEARPLKKKERFVR